MKYLLVLLCSALSVIGQPFGLSDTAFLATARKGPPPLDSFSGPAPLAAWSMYRLKSGVSTGYRLRMNITGVETDYAPSQIASPTNTSSISILYDQSGNGNNLTQTITNTQPIYKISPRGNRMVADMHSFPHVFPYNQTGTSGNKTWDMPATLSVNGRDTTVITVFLGSAHTYSSGLALGVWPWMQWTTTNVYHAIYNTSAELVQEIAWVGGGANTFTKAWRPNDANFQIHTWRSSSAGQKILIDSTLTNGVSTLGSNLQFTNGITASIGRFTLAGSWEYGTERLATMVFPTLTDAQILELEGLIRKYFGLVKPTRLVVIDGDSITAGYQSAALGTDWRDLSWSFEMQTAHPEYSLFMPNGARSGQTMTNLNTDASNKVDRCFTSLWSTNIVIVAAGINDIFYGATAADTMTQMESYITNRKTAGFKVIACNLIPRQDLSGAQETVRIAYNTLFNSAATAAWTDVVKVDLAVLNWIPGASYTVNYQDGIHPNAAGRALIANAVWAALQPLL